MKRLHALFTSLILGLLSLPTWAAQPLVSPKELQSLLAVPHLRIIDIRSPLAYAAGHIPGAVNAPYDQWRGPASNPGALPGLPTLTKLVQQLGLTPTSHVVVVSSGIEPSDFGASARVYWTLKVLGIPSLSVLNGGAYAWTEAKLPQSKQTPKVVASSFQPQIDSAMVATTNEVLQHVKAKDALLVDARPRNFYMGQTRAPAAKVAGTLPAAINLEHEQWLDLGSSTFVDIEQARQIASDSQIDPKRPTISFCNTGHWAATNWFALSEVLGHQNVKLYPGSMAEWSQSPAGLPVANAPSRVNQLWMDAKLWVNKTFN